MNNAAAINSSSGVTVANNAELQFNKTGTNTFTGPAMTISGTGVGSAGAINNIASGVNTYNGNLTLGAATTIQDNGTLTLGGTIGNGGFALTVNGSGAPNLNGAISGGGALIYSGTGSLDLGGSNTYTGTTTVSSGILALTNAAAINSSSGVTVANNAELQFNKTGTNTFTGPAMTISGTGVSSAGAINNIASGVNTYNGNLTLGAATTIQDNGALTLGGTIGNGGNLFTVNGSGTSDPGRSRLWRRAG